MARISRRFISTVALMLAPAMAQGQLVVGSGIGLVDNRDTRWYIATLDGAFSQGYVLPARPGQPNLPGSYLWIGATPSGTITGLFTNYIARTTFNLNAGDRLSVTMRCALDNTPLGIWVNGVQAAGANGCGGATGGAVFGAAQTFTGFIAGENTIEVRYTGDGTTDGIVVSIDSFELNGPITPGVVPEPSTYLLLASGLGVLALVARRRRSRAS